MKGEKETNTIDWTQAIDRFSDKIFLVTSILQLPIHILYLSELEFAKVWLMLIFQVLKNISNEKNHTVVLPIPNILMKNQVEKSRKVWTMCFSNKLIFYQEDNFDLLKD